MLDHRRGKSAVKDSCAIDIICCARNCCNGNRAGCKRTPKHNPSLSQAHKRLRWLTSSLSQRRDVGVRHQTHLENHPSDGCTRLHGASRRKPPESLSPTVMVATPRRRSTCGGIPPCCAAVFPIRPQAIAVAGTSATSVNRPTTWIHESRTEEHCYQ